MKTKRLSEILVDYGYDRKEMRKFFKDIKNAITSHFNETTEPLMIDDLLTVYLAKYDPRINPYTRDKNFYINFYPQAKYNRTFAYGLRYLTRHFLTDEETEYNKQVEEKIGIQKADNGAAEEDEESVLLL